MTQKNWIKRLTILLTFALVAGYFPVGSGTQSAYANSGLVKPGGPNGSDPVLWLKADASISDSDGTLTNWEDQSRNVAFEVYGAPKSVSSGINFNPVIDFNNAGQSNLVLPTNRMVGDQQITFNSGFVVFDATGRPQHAQGGAIVGSLESGSSYGKAVFAYYAGGSFVGNGENGTYDGVPLPNPLTKPYLVNYEIDGSNQHAGSRDGQPTAPVPSPKSFGPQTFVPVIGGTNSGSNSNNWGPYNGKVAEIILFDGSTNAERAQIESYLGIKYGMTLNNGVYTYVDSTNAPVWDSVANAVYGHRITGIGQDSGNGLLQKQSKSIEQGSLVTVALGSGIESSNQANLNSIAIDQSFFMFGDNNGSTVFNQPAADANAPEGLKSMSREFKVGKTNWQDADITLALSGANQNDAYYLLVDGAFSPERKLNASGEITLNSSELVDGAAFTFARLDGPQGIFTSAGTTYTSGAEVAVDPALTITLNDPDVLDANGHLDGATVVINGLQTGDKLIYTTQNGISGTYNAANGVLTLTGAATVEAYEQTLRSVRFSTTSGTVDRDIVFTLGKALPFSGNGHFYEYKNVNAIQWGAAKTAAANLNYFGRQGYLATITSWEENNFVAEKTQGIGWIGAQDIARSNGQTRVPGVTGDWRWVTGPEGLEDSGKGTKFWDGYSGETGHNKSVGGSFANWASGEPNDSGGGEYVAHIYSTGVQAGKWNDFAPTNNTTKGYIVEYGGMAGDNLSIAISATKKVGMIDKSALQQEVSKSGGLTTKKDTYTQASWDRYQEELDKANAVLDNPAASQNEVNAALAALAAAREALEEQLTLVKVTVEDAAPNQATLTFNKAIDGQLTVDDFKGLTINGQSVTAVEIDGDKVKVTLSEPIAPGQITVAYDPSQGDVSAAGNPANKLDAIGAGNQQGIAVDNGIIPLKLVTATVEGAQQDKLRLVFNRDIDNDFDLTGLTVGGIPVEGPFIIEGNEIVVTLPAAYQAGDKLAYDKTEPSHVQQAGNKNNKLENIVPGIAVPYVDGKLSEAGFGLIGGGKEIGLSPAFDPAVPSGYEGIVPNDMTSIGLSPVAADAAGTIVKASVNGVEVEDLNNLPLAEGVNTIKVNIYDKNNPTVLLGQYTVTIVRATGKLTGLMPSAGTLSPAFDSNTKDYAVNVGSESGSIKLTPTALDPEAKIEISVNGGGKIAAVSGVASADLPLNYGDNKIVVTVTDRTGKVTEYTVNVNRANSYVYVPSAPTDTTQTITVDVVIGGDDAADITKVDIKRTTHADGRISDQVAFTPEKAQETADKAKKSGKNIARIVIPDPNDKVSEVNVNVLKEAAAILLKNKIDLEIYTDNAIIRIPAASLEGVDGDFYFRLVPIKDSGEREAVEQRARTEQIVRKFANNDQIKVVARPMTIETNLSSRPVVLTLPLRDVALPQDAKERETFLNELGVFIEHSDGEKEIVRGEVVKLANGELGLRFGITKFSTFTILHFAGLQTQTENSHKHYINGYKDGTFRPNQSITRAEMASMLANIGAAGTALSDAAFPDVAQNHWATTVISKVNAAGLMKGYPNGKFQASGKITRAEMAVIVFNYLEMKPSDSDSFKDVPASHWASGIIATVNESGLFDGYPDGTFQPGKELSRAEAVTILNRLFDRGPLYGVDKAGWPDVAESHWAYADIEEASIDHAYTARPQGGEQWTAQ